MSDSRQSLVAPIRLAIFLTGFLTLHLSEAFGQEQALLWPMSGDSTQQDVINSPYGIRSLYSQVWGHYYYDFHNGLDLHAEWRQPIHASYSGQVTGQGWSDDLGWLRVVTYFRASPKYLRFLYGHLDDYDSTQLYQPVSPRDTICLAGHSGPIGTPNHLHLIAAPSNSSKWWNNNDPKANPVRYFPREQIADSVPRITNVDTVFSGDDTLDYVDITIEVNKRQMDLVFYEVIHWGIPDLYNGMFVVQYFVEGQSVMEAGLNMLFYWDDILVKNGDSLNYFFRYCHPVVETAISFYADPFSAGTDTAFVMHFKIDPVQDLIPLERLGFQAININGRVARWGNFGGCPFMLVQEFYATLQGEYVRLHCRGQLAGGCSEIKLTRLSVSESTSETVWKTLTGDHLGVVDFVFVDSAADPTREYMYKLIALSRDGKEEVVGVCRYEGIPASFALAQNYPNPFNPTTTIEFEIPGTKVVSTELTIYNILGQEVKTLHEGRTVPGKYIKAWDGTDENNNPVAAGVYLYRLKAGSFTETKKMLLLK